MHEGLKNVSNTSQKISQQWQPLMKKVIQFIKETIVEKNVIHLDNCCVIPYNPLLLIMFQSHINIEWCNQWNSIKYLFKYIIKECDCVTAKLYNANQNSKNGE